MSQQKNNHNTLYNATIMSKVTVHFDSRERDSGSQVKPSFILQPNGIGDGHGITRFYVDSATIPYTFYPWPLLSILEFSEDGGTFFLPANIPDGNYSAPTLANLVATALTNGSTNGATYIGSYDSATGKMSFQQTVAGTATSFIIRGALDPAAVSVEAARALGFTSTVTAVPQNAALSGSSAVDLAVDHHNLYIRCPDVQVGHSTSIFRNQKDRVILKFPLLGSPGSIMQYQSTDLNRFNLDGIKHLNQIGFELVNERGVGVDLNGLDWQISVVFISESP